MCVLLGWESRFGRTRYCISSRRHIHRNGPIFLMRKGCAGENLAPKSHRFLVTAPIYCDGNFLAPLICMLEA